MGGGTSVYVLEVANETWRQDWVTIHTPLFAATQPGDSFLLCGGDHFGRDTGKSTSKGGMFLTES